MLVVRKEQSYVKIELDLIKITLVNNLNRKRQHANNNKGVDNCKVGFDHEIMGLSITLEIEIESGSTCIHQASIFLN